MYEKLFSKRLAEPRIQKGVSARDMSLSLGQNPGYIRMTESGSAFPAMSNFFYICEYLNVIPQEFFDFKEDHADGINALVDQLDKLDEEQIQALAAFIKTIVKQLGITAKMPTSFKPVGILLLVPYYRQLLYLAANLFVIKYKNHIWSTFKKSYITPPACAAFAVEQTNELLLHFTSAVRTDPLAGSHKSLLELGDNFISGHTAGK